MAKFTTIRTFVAIGLAINFEMHQIDIKTTFLNGELEEDIHMEQSLGFIQQSKHYHVCKLKKSLYRLKQSSSAWFQFICLFFKKEGLIKNKINSFAQALQVKDLLLDVIVYVDDLIIISNTIVRLDWLKKKLKKEFEMSN